MQRLAQTQPEIHQAPTPSSGHPHGDRLRQQVEAYQRHLADCTPAMLQYEWAWLDQHIADLELCLSQPEMLVTAGGPAAVSQRLTESRQCQMALERTMCQRGVEPALHGHAVASGEHAWELREETIKQLWGWS